MTAILFDTLDFAAKLKAGGFTEQQAETQARAIADIVEKQLNTKQEIQGYPLKPGQNQGFAAQSCIMS